MNILFVCRANVARSQIAEAIFNTLAQGKHVAVSAGTQVVKEDGTSKEGEKLNESTFGNDVIRVLAEKEIDATQCSRKQVTPDLIAKADEVIALCNQADAPDFVVHNARTSWWDIPETKGDVMDGLRVTRDEIEKRVEALLGELR